MRVLILAILMLLLTACAASPPPVIQTKTVYRYPPATLMAPTDNPEYTGTTWGEVGDYAVLIRSLLMQCNADKAAIRDWSHQ